MLVVSGVGEAGYDRFQTPPNLCKQAAEYTTDGVKKGNGARICPQTIGCIVGKPNGTPFAIGGDKERPPLLHGGLGFWGYFL